MIARVVALLAWVACGDPSSSPLPTADTGAGPCDTGPQQSWETFGQGFVRSQCQGCHASTAVDRFGAPEEVTFDTEEQVLVFSERILARATGPDADMPPAGGPSEDDRIRLERWLTCDLR
ncbi:MAG: hypothetical protein AAF211_34260 [Myxococcota bacterium]